MDCSGMDAFDLYELPDEFRAELSPNPDVHALFQYYNQLYFDGELGACSVEWSSSRMTMCAGTCAFQPGGGCVIKLSEPILKLRPPEDLKETLLHEMIHAYIFLLRIPNAGKDGHGAPFLERMRRINAATATDMYRPACGYNITVFHSMHAEVDHYRVHWWECDRCAKTIKRAMNRPPQVADCRRRQGQGDECRDTHCAYHMHIKTCGGNFIKIKEPEKSTKPPRVLRKPKSSGTVAAMGSSGVGGKRGAPDGGGGEADDLKRRKRDGMVPIADYFNPPPSADAPTAAAAEGPSQPLPIHTIRDAVPASTAAKPASVAGAQRNSTPVLDLTDSPTAPSFPVRPPSQINDVFFMSDDEALSTPRAASPLEPFSGTYSGGLRDPGSPLTLAQAAAAAGERHARANATDRRDSNAAANHGSAPGDAAGPSTGTARGTARAGSSKHPDITGPSTATARGTARAGSSEHLDTSASAKAAGTAAAPSAGIARGRGPGVRPPPLPADSARRTPAPAHAASTPAERADRSLFGAGKPLPKHAQFRKVPVQAGNASADPDIKETDMDSVQDCGHPGVAAQLLAAAHLERMVRAELAGTSLRVENPQARGSAEQSGGGNRAAGDFTDQQPASMVVELLSDSDDDAPACRAASASAVDALEGHVSAMSIRGPGVSQQGGEGAGDRGVMDARAARELRASAALKRRAEGA